MKSVLLSIRPQWCELIASGKKTVEVRKTAPKLKTPFKVYMYCTKGKTFLYRNPNNGELFLDSNGGYRGGDYEDRYLTGKVIGEFVCSKIYEIEYGGCRYMINNDRSFTNRIAEESCLWYDDLYRYLGDKTGYGWIITNVKIYDNPKELCEFKPWCEKYIIAYDPLEVCCDCKNAVYDEYGELYGCGLARPPQSWCYVEELI